MKRNIIEMNYHLKNILDQYGFHGWTDGTMDSFTTTLFILNSDLKFEINILLQKNKKTKYILIWVYSGENNKNKFMLKKISLTSITKELSKPSESFGTIYSFCKALGIDTPECYFANNNKKIFNFIFSEQLPQVQCLSST